MSTAVKWGCAGPSLRSVLFLNLYIDFSTGCKYFLLTKYEGWHFYKECCLLKVYNFPFTFTSIIASTFRPKDFHKFQFVNSGKQKDQKNALILLQAVDQARKTENETKSTSKIMNATQPKGCFRWERNATAANHMVHWNQGGHQHSPWMYMKFSSFIL